MWAEQLKGHLDGLLLAVLEEGALHGYAVIEALRARSSGAFDLPSGTIYPALHRLEMTGLVMSERSTVAGRRRRTYSLTGRGHEFLESERQSWRTFSGAVASLLGSAS